MRRAISVTLERDNVTWLKARAGAERESVSELLDQIVTAARQGGARTGPSRSVVGTIDVDSSDPLLARADAAVRSAFDASLQRPLVVREGRAGYAGRRAKPTRTARRTPRG